MTSPRHTHTPVPDKAGRNICSTCQMVVWEPIRSSDDPRLAEAGFMRSHHHEIVENVYFPPLPELLLALHYNAEYLGLLRQAPPAHYIHLVAQEEGRKFDRGLTKYHDPDDIWEHLSRGLDSVKQSGKNTNQQ